MTESNKNILKNKENTRFCLIQAASKLFSSLGYDKVSTRDLAQVAQVNISMISYHFGGKEGLYKQVLFDFAENIKNNVEEIFTEFTSREINKENFIKTMSRVIDHMVHNRIDNPEICILLSREKIEGLPHSREVHEILFSPLVKKFIFLIEKAQESKIIRADLKPLLFFTLLTEGIWGFFELTACHISGFEHHTHLLKDPIELRNEIIKIYLEGALL